MQESLAIAYGYFDCDFGFDSQEWSRSEGRVGVGVDVALERLPQVMPSHGVVATGQVISENPEITYPVDFVI